MPLNLHKVFSGSPENDYLSALSVRDQTEKVLRRARDEIRSTLRTALSNLAQFSRATLFEATATATPRSLRPKFRMQGSFSYRTCNDPAHKPPQQIDLDDGMFVPISYLHANSEGRRPALLSQGLFAAVESALQPLCDRNGWKLKQKPSCVRVELSPDAHIDIALYSIPDGEFTMLVEKAELALNSQDRARIQDELAHDQLPESVYRILADGQIMLAHREEGWKPSDPRKLEDWFQGAVERHGNHLRRVCRYLKGWRDFVWQSCRLSSIVLMAAAVKVFNEDQQLADLDNRDDKVLLAICEKLPAILSNRIANPVVPGQWLDENWSPDQRAAFVEAARKLSNYVRDALATGNATLALTQLQNGFGDRIPTDVRLVANDNSLEFKAAAPAVLVGATAPASDSERMRRAEAAARDIEARGQQSRPWSR